ncbi:MAG: CotH kinase family protein [Bacteroidales bacterium]|nr:CotH kinase family protein [Bacteroidales bacterium]
MKRVLLFFMVSLLAIFNCQQLMAQEGEGIKLTIQSASVSVQGYMDNTADKIADGNYATKFESLNGQEVGTTATVTLAEEAKLQKVKLYFCNNLYYYCPNKIKLQVSTDNVTWTDVEGSEVALQDVAVYDNATVANVVTINTNGVAAKYVRMEIVEIGNSWFQLYEFEVYRSETVDARTISVSVNDSSMGEAYIGAEGITEVTNQTGYVTITAQPAEGYKFTGWTLNGEVVSTSETYSDLEAGDKEYIANFRALKVFNVSVSVNNTEMGSATATQTGDILEDTQVTFTAVPTGENKFENWKANGVIVSLENPYIATITDDIELVANFTDKYPQLTTVPTIYINTENGVGVTSKDDYVNAYVTVRGAENEEDNITEVLTEIKGRGNSTWGMAKKPYRLKFDKKIKFLGNEAKEKNWVLLANYADKTLMRNALAFETARNMMNFGFTPSVTFVDVVLNGENLGSYMLTDQVEVKSKRVPVTEQETTTTMSDPEITGGYLIEVDGFADSEISWFQTTKGMKVTIKYPKDDEINTDQSTYIANYTQNMENAMFGANFTDAELGWRQYIDEASMVDWYIACELFGNSDSWWSTYMYKERDAVFKFGPLWDFDIAFNNDSRLGDATNLMMRTYAHDPKTWIARWWQDAGFVSAVKARWAELRKAGLKEFMINYINNTEEYLQTSQQNNFNIWNILNTKVYYELAARGSYAAEVEFLRSYVNGRISYLDAQFELPQLYTVTAKSADATMGTATVSSAYAFANDEVTLTASPAEGYEFINWSVNGTEVSIENPYTATITANTEFVANFEVLSGIISTESSSETIKVTVSGSEIKLFGTIAGEEVTLYTANGVVIAKAETQDAVTAISTTATGVIIVKVGEQVLKVVK